MDKYGLGGSPPNPRIPEHLTPLLSRLAEQILKALPHVQAIYAYGSRVRGTVHAESDLDLALLLPPALRSIAEASLLQLAGDLEVLAGFPVHISILDLELRVVHCKEVVAQGETFYTADAHAVALFEMMTLSYYARLCEDRKPVVEAYGERGA